MDSKELGKKIKEWYGLWEAINKFDCFGVNDLILERQLAKELDDAGVSLDENALGDSVVLINGFYDCACFDMNFIKDLRLSIDSGRISGGHETICYLCWTVFDDAPSSRLLEVADALEDGRLIW